MPHKCRNVALRRHARPATSSADFSGVYNDRAHNTGAPVASRGVRAMGRRSENLFKRNDVMRAIASVRDAGVPVATVEIMCKDGTVIKVHGPDALAARHEQPLDTWLQKCASGSKASIQSASGSPVAASEFITTPGKAGHVSTASRARRSSSLATTKPS